MGKRSGEVGGRAICQGMRGGSREAECSAVGGYPPPPSSSLSKDGCVIYGVKKVAEIMMMCGGELHASLEGGKGDRRRARAEKGGFESGNVLSDPIRTADSTQRGASDKL